VQGGKRHEFGWRAKEGQTLRLGDYLEFARERSISAELELRFGVIELGRVLLVSGDVRHAELPGSSGERALSLLCSLARIEVEVRSLTSDGPTTLRGDWRSIIRTSPLTQEARKALISAFAGHLKPAVAPPTTVERSPPLRIPGLRTGRAAPPETPSPLHLSPKLPSAKTEADFDTLFIQAMRAYGRRDHHAALDLFDQCADLRPDDSRVQHNRLRLRKRLGMP